MISKRAQCLKPSPTLAMAAKAKELQSQGQDVISLTVGEPDWATFPAIAEAGIQAIKDGFTKYTVAHGIPELRAAVAQDTNRFLKTSYQANDVVIGTGAKYIIYAALQMLVDPGDEVIVPAPYWVSYPTMAELAGAKVIVPACDEKSRFKMTAEVFRKAITPKTKVLIHCSPSNPTGIQYTEDELKELAQVLRENPHVYVISDDIYNRLVFHKESLAPHLLLVAPDLKDRVVVVNGASKSYSMTGWRVGWALGPQELIKVMADFISQSTSNVASMSQRAALVGLQKCDPDISAAVEELKKKKDFFMTGLNQISNLKVIPPDGAFYIWLDVQGCIGKKHSSSGRVIRGSKDIAEILLEKHLMATVPGAEFGTEGYIRLSFATSQKNIEKSIQRFQEFSAQLN
ncbi:MAG: aminotransferase [Oligoflexia bacterium]|nr:MAG: aminotransferase [Oligoflexia bacterium]